MTRYLLGMAFAVAAAVMPAADICSEDIAQKCDCMQDVPGCPIVWVIWAESFRDASPSLLLGYALLTSRRESALFLRMATGFGFAQVWVLLCPC